MTTETTNSTPTNTGPTSGAAHVPAAAPESGAAAVAPAGGSSTSEAALVAEVLGNAAPAAASDTAITRRTEEDEVKDSDEVNQFDNLDKEFEAVEEDSTGATSQPAVPAAPAAQPAPSKAADTVQTQQVPAAAAPTTEGGSSTAQSKPKAETVQSDAFDLFAPVAPSSTPVQQTEPAKGDTQQQSTSTEMPNLVEANAQRMKELREKYTADLENLYAFGEDDARAVMLEPEKVLPKHFAKLHTGVVEAAMTGLIQQLPRMIVDILNARTSQAELNRNFFGTWPQLSKPEYADTVRRMLATHRQNNPNAQWDQVVKEVGAASLLALKLPLPAELAQQTQQRTAAPSMPAITPANPGGAAPVAAGSARNPFEVFNDDWDAEERMSEQ